MLRLFQIIKIEFLSNWNFSREPSLFVYAATAFPVIRKVSGKTQNTLQSKVKGQKKLEH